MRIGLAVIALFAVVGCGKNLPPGADAYVTNGCKEVHREEIRTYYNCEGKIIDFRDQVAIPEAKKQGAKVDPKYVMIYKKGTYTIATTKGQYAVVDGEAEADTSKPGYALMILTYKLPNSP